jgi:RHS repeat-associated protein
MMIPAASSSAQRPNSCDHFTGKERDAETGLDYFGERYFSSPQGRFTSPDPKSKSAKIAFPQSWNRYVYTPNNPLKFIDHDGMDIVLANMKDKDRAYVVQFIDNVNKGDETASEAAEGAFGKLPNKASESDIKAIEEMLKKRSQ